MLHAVGRTEFDHAVVMVRDRLDALAPHFERQGFHLSDKAVHNLGSCNRLIVLEGTYIELLGWRAPPARARNRRFAVWAGSPGLPHTRRRSHLRAAARRRLCRQSGAGTQPSRSVGRT